MFRETVAEAYGCEYSGNSTKESHTLITLPEVSHPHQQRFDDEYLAELWELDSHFRLLEKAKYQRRIEFSHTRVYGTRVGYRCSEHGKT